MKSHRALFIKTKHLGDAVVLTSSIHAMPRGWTIDVLCFEECAPIFDGNPKIGHVHTIPNRAKTAVRRLGAYWRLIQNILQNNYQLIVQYSDDWRGALIAALLRPAHSVCGATEKRGVIWHKIFRAVAKRPKGFRHVAELDMDLLRVAGIHVPAEAPAYQLFVPDLADRFILEWLNERKLNSKNYIVVHGSSRWSFKQISVEQWRTVLSGLLHSGYQVVLSGAPEDREYNLKICIEGVTVSDDFSLQQSFALIMNARAVVSIDSLIVHAAAAFHVPVVAIYGPSGEKHWAPWRTHHVIVENHAQYPCRPCGMDGCGGSKVSQCLLSLSSERILSSVRGLLRDSSDVTIGPVPR